MTVIDGLVEDGHVTKDSLFNEDTEVPVFSLEDEATSMLISAVIVSALTVFATFVSIWRASKCVCIRHLFIKCKSRTTHSAGSYSSTDGNPEQSRSAAREETRVLMEMEVLGPRSNQQDDQHPVAESTESSMDLVGCHTMQHSTDVCGCVQQSNTQVVQSTEVHDGLSESPQDYSQTGSHRRVRFDESHNIQNAGATETSVTTICDCTCGTECTVEDGSISQPIQIPKRLLQSCSRYNNTGITNSGTRLHSPVSQSSTSQFTFSLSHPPSLRQSYSLSRVRPVTCAHHHHPLLVHSSGLQSSNSRNQHVSRSENSPPPYDQTPPPAYNYLFPDRA